MSKNKQKDKKNDATALIQKQYEAQKRDVIDYQFTIKKLEQRLAEKILENEQLSKQLQQVHLVDKQKIKILNERAEDDEKRLTSQINRITQLQINATRFQSQIRSLKDELSSQKESHQKKVLELQITLQKERKQALMQKQNSSISAANREKNQQQLLNLKQKIQYEKAEKVRQLADKQRQKVQATDKLRDEMLKKIRQMRTNLLSLKKEQLSTTTRLTILQNHQLTSELQYQSKQTQKLIFKQEDMQEKIKTLTQQLAIHKQVEEQLAKRAHFSKGVIKKLNDRVAELEKQIENSKNSRAIQSAKNISYQNSGTKSKLYIEAPDDGNGKQMLAQIQKQLQITEKKYSETNSKLQVTQKQKESLSNQLKRYENSCNQLSKILINFSEQILNKKTLQVDKQAPQDLIDPVLKIDLQQLRTKKVQQWDHEQTSLIVKILLNLIKPYLNKKNVMIPAIRRLLVVEDSKFGKSDSKLPKIIEQVNENNETGAKGLKDLPINIASKIVGSNLRQWGNTVKLSQNAMLRKKYKISQSHR